MVGVIAQRQSHSFHNQPVDLRPCARRCVMGAGMGCGEWWGVLSGRRGVPRVHAGCGALLLHRLGGPRTLPSLRTDLGVTLTAARSHRPPGLSVIARPAGRRGGHHGAAAATEQGDDDMRGGSGADGAVRGDGAAAATEQGDDGEQGEEPSEESLPRRERVAPPSAPVTGVISTSHSPASSSNVIRTPPPRISGTGSRFRSARWRSTVSEPGRGSGLPTAMARQLHQPES